jgi:hypothetical protein
MMHTHVYVHRWAKSVARHYAAMEEQWSQPEEYADWPFNNKNKKKSASSSDSSDDSGGSATDGSSSSSGSSKDANKPKDTKQVSETLAVHCTHQHVSVHHVYVCIVIVTCIE